MILRHHVPECLLADLVDNVSKEADAAGEHAAAYIKAFEDSDDHTVNENDPDSKLMQRFAARNATRNGAVSNEAKILPDGSRTYTIPCIVCPAGCMIEVTEKDGEVINVTGNNCERGDAYARSEAIAPVRTVTTSGKVTGSDRSVVAVKTAEAIPKGKIFDCIDEASKITAKAPVSIGDVMIANVAQTGIDLVATADAPAM